MAKPKIIQSSGFRKSAVARAVIREGTGLVRINSARLDTFGTSMGRQKIMEPLILAGDISSKVNIDIRVNGGGQNSQAEAIRLAIARGLVAFSKSKKLEDEFERYDRHLLVADIRRKEMKKPNTQSSARSKRQKSYR